MLPQLAQPKPRGELARVQASFRNQEAAGSTGQTTEAQDEPPRQPPQAPGLKGAPLAAPKRRTVAGMPGVEPRAAWSQQGASNPRVQASNPQAQASNPTAVRRPRRALLRGQPICAPSGPSSQFWALLQPSSSSALFEYFVVDGRNTLPPEQNSGGGRDGTDQSNVRQLRNWGPQLAPGVPGGRNRAFSVRFQCDAPSWRALTAAAVEMPREVINGHDSDGANHSTERHAQSCAALLLARGVVCCLFEPMLQTLLRRTRHRQEFERFATSRAPHASSP